MRRTLIHWFTGLLLVAAPLEAQQSDTSSIPIALARALHSAGAASARYWVGELPTGFPSALVPPGPVMILGGMRERGRFIVVLRDTTRRLAAVMQEHLEAVGWKHPVPDADPGFAGTQRNLDVWCLDSAGIYMGALGGSPPSVVRITYDPPGIPSQCGFIRVRVDRVETVSSLPLPSLPTPPGVESPGSNGSSGTDERSAWTHLTGDITAASAAEHYAKLISAAGWSVTAPSTNERLSARALEAKDSTGAVWTGWFLAFKRDDGVDVTISMHKQSPRRR